MFNLDGKTALVTGASGGIGQAIVASLHQQGATVIMSGTKVDTLNKIAGNLKERIHFVVADLSHGGDVENLVKNAEIALGKEVDILVNNAGITKDNLSIRMKDEDWASVIDLNLTVCFKLARQVLRGMMKRRWGRIINISSVVGVTGNAGQANYAAAKAGLIGMTKSLALEVASRNITINAIAPGFIVTPMTDKLTQEQKDKLIQQIPMGRLGIAEDIGSSVAFLASEEASYITGQTLHINGGMAMI